MPTGLPAVISKQAHLQATQRSCISALMSKAVQLASGRPSKGHNNPVEAHKNDITSLKTKLRQRWAAAGRGS